jgi:hypothetical protein
MLRRAYRDLGWNGLRWTEYVLRPLAWMAIAAALMACSSEPRGNLKYIEQDQFAIGNPSKDRALATGIGCGFTMHEAEAAAEEVAQFNLRRLTGEARYRVEFTRLREIPDTQKACIELQARAVPPRLR